MGIVMTEDTDNDAMPEVIRLHSAIAMMIMCLEMIARDQGPPSRMIAQTALKVLRERHPDTVEHMTPEPDDT
jgi:hypothetical protein